MAPTGKIGCLIWFSGDLPTKPSFQSYSRSFSTPPAAKREEQRNSDIFYRGRLNIAALNFFKGTGTEDKQRSKEKTKKDKGKYKRKGKRKRQYDKDSATVGQKSGQVLQMGGKASKEASDSTDSGGAGRRNISRGNLA